MFKLNLSGSEIILQFNSQQNFFKYLRCHIAYCFEVQSDFQREFLNLELSDTILPITDRRILWPLLPYHFVTCQFSTTVQLTFRQISWTNFGPFFFFHINVSLRVAWVNSRLFSRSLLQPSQNDVWVTSAEIPYWWRVTIQILVVLPIGWNFLSTNQNVSAKRFLLFHYFKF